MGVTTLKFISILIIFILMQGIFIPWLVSNNRLPLWLDVILVVSIFGACCSVVFEVIMMVIKNINK